MDFLRARRLDLIFYPPTLLLDLFLLEHYLKGGIIYWIDSGFPFIPSLWLYKIFVDYWNYNFFPGAPFSYSQHNLFTALIFYLLIQVLNLSFSTSELVYLLLFFFLAKVGFVKMIDTLLSLLGRETNKSYIYLSGILGGFMYTWGFFGYRPPILGVNYPFFVFYMLFPLLLHFAMKYVFLERNYLTLTLLPIYIIMLSGNQFVTASYTLWILVIYLIMFISLYTERRKNISFKLFLTKNLILYGLAIIAGLEELYNVYFASLNAFSSGVYGQFNGMPLAIAELQDQYNSFTPLSLFSLFAPNRYTWIGLLLFVVLVIISILSVKNKTDNKLFNPSFFSLLIIGGATVGFVNLVPLFSLSQSSIGFIAVGLMFSVQFVFSGFPVAFFLSFLVSYAIVIFLRTFNSNRKKILSLLFLSILVSVYMSTFVVSDSYQQIKTFDYLPVAATNVFYPPEELLEVGYYLHQNAENYNVLLLPLQYIAGIYYIHDNVTMASLHNIDPLSQFITGTIVKLPIPNTVTNPLYLYFPGNFKNVTNFLVLLGIKYIVLSKNEYPGPGVPLYQAGGYPWNFSKFEYYLSHLPNATLTLENNYYNVYRINLNVSLIYASEGIVVNTLDYNQIFLTYSNNLLTAQRQSLIYGNGAVNITNISGVKMTVINNYNNVMYVVKVNATKPFYLVLDEGYSNFWRVIIKSHEVKSHYLANGYANSWLMPAGEYTAIVEFYPANIIPYFFIISLLSPVVIALIILVKDRIRLRHVRWEK